MSECTELTPEFYEANSSLTISTHNLKSRVLEQLRIISRQQLRYSSRRSQLSNKDPELYIISEGTTFVSWLFWFLAQPSQINSFIPMRGHKTTHLERERAYCAVQWICEIRNLPVKRVVLQPPDKNDMRGDSCSPETGRSPTRLIRASNWPIGELHFSPLNWRHCIFYLIYLFISRVFRKKIIIIIITSNTLICIFS